TRAELQCACRAIESPAFELAVCGYESRAAFTASLTGRPCSRRRFQYTPRCASKAQPACIYHTPQDTRSGCCRPRAPTRGLRCTYTGQTLDSQPGGNG